MTWRKATVDRGRPDRSLDYRRGHTAELPPGPPPWAKTDGLSAAAVVFMVLLGCTAAYWVVTLLLGLWRLVDQAADPR